MESRQENRKKKKLMVLNVQNNTCLVAVSRRVSISDNFNFLCTNLGESQKQKNDKLRKSVMQQ